MSTLTEELAEDHAAILEMLERAGTDGVDTRQGQDMLHTVKEVLLSHFKKEDSVVYPALMKASEKDPDLRQLLGMFLKDLEKLTRSAMDFLEKYSEGGAPEEFAKDLASFKSAFEKRVASEEEVLYRKFDAIY